MLTQTRRMMERRTAAALIAALEQAEVLLPPGVNRAMPALLPLLHLSFRYPHPQFGPQAAARFAGRYVKALTHPTRPRQIK